MHLIKQRAENRTTRSWDLSIKNSVREIQRTNQRRKAKGNYCEPSELREALEDAYEIAIDHRTQLSRLILSLKSLTRRSI